jgi:pimeloyl-ACP methyl ester carboxylesterase/DNA-binding CsgD family transcriptional regulator
VNVVRFFGRVVDSVTIHQGNLRSLFHASLLEHAKQGRALDAISDGWEMLDFHPDDCMTAKELDVWDQAAEHSIQRPAMSSQAAPGSFATAVLTARGTIASVDPNFALWLGSAEMAVTLTEMRDLARLARSGRAARRLLNDLSGRPILVAGLQRFSGLAWPLSESAKTALEADETTICLVAFAPTRSDTLLSSVRTVFGLSPAESKLAIALLQHDSLEAAAHDIGITEATANGYRKALFKKMGVKRRSEMVQMILEIGHRERSYSQSRISHAFQDMLGFTKDQIAILEALTEGHTIPQAAQILGINIHTARDHVRTMFELVGVNKQSELVRVALEYSALEALSESSEVNANSVSDLLSNTRVIARPEGGLVYLGDYGPRDGVPVLFFHAGLGTRRLDPNFLRQSARAGLRVVAVERPGFGGTDLRAEPGFEGSSADAAMVLGKLGIEKAIVASIGGGNIAALSFAGRFPNHVRAGLLINPTPPRKFGTKAHSPAAAFREMTFANPIVIRAMAKVIRNQMRSDLLDNMLSKYFSTCEADRLAMAIPEVRALQRASTQAAMARTIEGFVREEETFVRHWSPPQLSSGPWTIAVGMDDHTCDAAAARRAWGYLPGFEMVEVMDAGRMICVSRSDMIVACLVALATGKPMPIDGQCDKGTKSAA